MLLQQGESRLPQPPYPGIEIEEWPHLDKLAGVEPHDLISGIPLRQQGLICDADPTERIQIGHAFTNPSDGMGKAG